MASACSPRFLAVDSIRSLFRVCWGVVARSGARRDNRISLRRHLRCATVDEHPWNYVTSHRCWRPWAIEHMHRCHPLDAVDGGHGCMDQHKLQSQRVQGDRVQVWPYNKSHNAQPVPERAHSTPCSKNRPISRMFAESSVRADPTATAARWPCMACVYFPSAFFVFRP